MYVSNLSMSVIYAIWAILQRNLPPYAFIPPWAAPSPLALAGSGIWEVLAGMSVRRMRSIIFSGDKRAMLYADAWGMMLSRWTTSRGKGVGDPCGL